MFNVLVACEFSGVVRDAFRRHGCEAWSCDLEPGEGPHHLQMDVTSLLAVPWHLIIAHPPCTYLCNSGVRWLYETEGRMQDMEAAAAFFNLFKERADLVCIENPIPHNKARKIIGDYTQVVQPWQFGHEEQKATCLWLHNLPPLTPTKVVGPPPKNPTASEKARWQRIHMLGQSKARGKLRSITYEGIAEAMASQWVPFMKVFYGS